MINDEMIDDEEYNANKLIIKSKALLAWFIVIYSVGLGAFILGIVHAEDSGIPLTICQVAIGLFMMVAGVLGGIYEGKGLHLASSMLLLINLKKEMEDKHE